MAWLPIRYSGFYDVPRAFAVEHQGAVLVFDCPFDDAADDFASFYRVFRIPGTTLDATAHLSLKAMVESGQPIGSVSAAVVRFDPTLRHSVDDSVLAAV